MARELAEFILGPSRRTQTALAEKPIRDYGSAAHEGERRNSKNSLLNRERGGEILIIANPHG